LFIEEQVAPLVHVSRKLTHLFTPCHQRRQPYGPTGVSAGLSVGSNCNRLAGYHPTILHCDFQELHLLHSNFQPGQNQALLRPCLAGWVSSGNLTHCLCSCCRGSKGRTAQATDKHNSAEQMQSPGNCNSAHTLCKQRFSPLSVSLLQAVQCMVELRPLGDQHAS
jgi:hypothetical protein